MSASNTPTRAPPAANASAKLAVVVDLPTHPLPDATAITFLTPGRPFDFAAAGILISTLFTIAVKPWH